MAAGFSGTAMQSYYILLCCTKKEKTKTFSGETENKKRKVEKDLGKMVKGFGESGERLCCI
jgi:hypothetical protein